MHFAARKDTTTVVKELPIIFCEGKLSQDTFLFQSFSAQFSREDIGGGVSVVVGWRVGEGGLVKHLNR
jgi:hypothetical protein